MTMEQIESRVKAIVAKEADVDTKLIRNDSPLAEDHPLDGLPIVEVVTAIEKAFGLRIPDRAAADLHTVGDAVDYLMRAH